MNDGKTNNIIEYNMEITRMIRAREMGQNPFTLWFTGLSGSGKSTLANEVEKRLVAMHMHTMSLDGDNVRLGLNKNLGFCKEDRIENIRRIAEVAKLMNDAGLIVLSSFISPYRGDREQARNIIGADHFLEIYVSTPLETCEKRDVKGLYQKARRGEIKDFTGVSGIYEAPYEPDISIDTTDYTIAEATDKIMKIIHAKLL